jgi:hypothetical protein
MTDAKNEDPNGEKTEAQPERLGYSIIEPPPEAPRSAPAKASQQKRATAGKTEEKPEPPPRYAIVEPVAESPRATPPQAAQEDTAGGKTEEKPEPLRYAIIEPPPPPPPDSFLQASLHHPVDASPGAKGKKPVGAPATGQPPAGEAPAERIRKPAQRPSRVFIWIVVGLGVLFGCILAVVFSRLANPDVPHDWVSSTSDAAGLKGHLYTKSEEKLEYRLTLQPADPDRHAAFALAIAHPPRPLSIEVHLQDAHGFVLCSMEILLKYNAANVPGIAAPNPDSQAGTANAVSAAGSASSQSVEKLLAAQEAERELGKEVFQNEIGPDGQVASLVAQGEFPCPDKAYASASTWSFTPNFPTLAEQDELVKRQHDVLATGAGPSAETPALRRKAARIPAPPLLSFTIEGDDAIVDFDISRGVIETRAEKTFLFDKTSGETGNPRWQEYPVSIHYICDQASRCTITHSGAGALHARMSR